MRLVAWIAMNANYFAQKPEDILRALSNRSGVRRVLFDGTEYDVLPNVFPSHEFRTTPFLCAAVRELAKGKRVCDMGCGFGMVGVTALRAGAERVVFVDINPTAVENATLNIMRLGFEDGSDVCVSNGFLSVPRQEFDLIVFNPPFHTEKREVGDSIDAAIYDPDFATMRHFLSELRAYTQKGSHVLIAYSDKGDVYGLEGLFTTHGYDWELWRKTNTDQKYDNRLYLLLL